MREVIGITFIWIANSLNILLAFGITALLLAFTALSGARPFIGSILFIIIIFCIAGLSWIALYRLLAKKDTRWKIVLALIGCLNLIGGIYHFEEISQSHAGASNMELLMNWKVWIFIVPAILYFASLPIIKRHEN